MESPDKETKLGTAGLGAASVEMANNSSKVHDCARDRLRFLVEPASPRQMNDDKHEDAARKVGQGVNAQAMAE